MSNIHIVNEFITELTYGVHSAMQSSDLQYDQSRIYK